MMRGIIYTQVSNKRERVSTHRSDLIIESVGTLLACFWITLKYNPEFKVYL